MSFGKCSITQGGLQVVLVESSFFSIKYIFGAGSIDNYKTAEELLLRAVAEFGLTLL